MEEILYLEADEEITSVVDKLKGLEAPSIGLVVPKGSTIAQSLVSLRLIKKEAEKLKKDISIITSDEVGRNLAAQADLPVFADVKSRTPIDVNQLEKAPENEQIEIDMSVGTASETAKKGKETKEVVEPEEELPEGLSVHRYDETALAADEPQNAKEETDEIEKVPEKEEQFVSREVRDVKPAPRPAHEIEAERPIRGPEAIKKDTSSKKRTFKPYLIAIALIVGLLVVLVGLDLVFARVKVTLLVPAEEIQKEASIVIEKDRQAIDLKQGIIPGVQEIKTKPVEKLFSATGKKDAGEQAKGTLTFKNEAGVDDTLTAGTTVTSTNNVSFTLNGAITIPKATLNSSGDKVLGQATGAVTAKSAGDNANMASSMTYVASGHSKVTVSGATSGGVTKQLTIVSRSDIEQAETALKDQGKTDLFQDLSADKNQVYLQDAGTVELSDFTPSKNAGDETDQFSAKGTIKYTTISFKSADFRQAIIKQVEKTLPQDKSLLPSDADSLTPTAKENNINVGKLTVIGNLTSHIGAKNDLGQLSKSLTLKRIKNVKAKLSEVPNATVVSVDLTPSFALPISPILSRNIVINLQYSKK